jgi:hypothetical protein
VNERRGRPRTRRSSWAGGLGARRAARARWPRCTWRMVTMADHRVSVDVARQRPRQLSGLGSTIDPPWYLDAPVLPKEVRHEGPKLASLARTRSRSGSTLGGDEEALGGRVHRRAARGIGDQDGIRDLIDDEVESIALAGPPPGGAELGSSPGPSVAPSRRSGRMDVPIPTGVPEVLLITRRGPIPRGIDQCEPRGDDVICSTALRPSARRTACC